MKKIIVILMILFISMGLFATAEEEGINTRLIPHFAWGLGLGSFNHLWLSNWEFIGLELTQQSVEDVGFYITTSIIIVEELYSNDWEGVKFWKLTSAFLGVVTAKRIWKGTDPMIYPKYYGKE